jgi:FkbM family methyltransferase
VSDLAADARRVREVGDLDVWFDGVAMRCDVAPAAPSPSLARYLDACADDDELWLLPGDVAVHALNGHELAYMAHEQLTADVYRLQDLGDRATVVDVGANVGIFTLLAAGRSERRVIAVEPIPRLAALVERTASLHGLADRISVLQCGLGPTAEDATFTFAPFFGALSSRHRAERADISRRVVLAVRMLLPRLAERHGVDLEAARQRISAELAETSVTVPIRRLSAVLRDEAIDEVNLLKIDVEGSELEVLLGVDDADWPRIARVAMEVNDVEGRLSHISELFAAHGFHVSVEDDPSASRVVPRRIALVHASREPLPARRNGTPRLDTTATLPALREEALGVGSAVARALRKGSEGAIAVRVCSPEVCGRRQGDRPEAQLLEPLASALAELLGVPSLRLAPGWATFGIVSPQVSPR